MTHHYAADGTSGEGGSSACSRGDRVNALAVQLKQACDGTGAYKKRVMRSKPYHYVDDMVIHSFVLLNEGLYLKYPPILPTLARGLFMRNLNESQAQVASGQQTLQPVQWEIVCRGYDKFFNLSELDTRKEHVAHPSLAPGPFELSVKENGCIIFVSAVDGKHLLVTSKHALGEGNAHAQKGQEWLDVHLSRAGKSRVELVRFLSDNGLTALFELVDDDFEEHILEYPKERRGLYLHGLNKNAVDFISLPVSERESFARNFGFFVVDSVLAPTFNDVMNIVNETRPTGMFNGREVEGFVIRYPASSFDPVARVNFFKVKFDEPYMMFREWRQITNLFLEGKLVSYKPTHFMAAKYHDWLQWLGQHDAAYFNDLFGQYLRNKGVIRARKAFLSYMKIESTQELLKLIANNPSAIPSAPLAERKVLLLPIATIGAGKTTLARVMSRLYPGIGHIQNDNISGRKDAFERAVISSFSHNRIVFADKNNHLSMHRTSLTQLFKSHYPEGVIIALDWRIDSANIENIVKVACRRVEQRSENHQSLTPLRAPAYRSIISNFCTRRDPLNLASASDRLIDHVVPLEVENGPRDHLKSILATLDVETPGLLNWSLPSNKAFDMAWQSALSVKETFVKAVKRNERKSKDAYLYAIVPTTELDIVALIDKTFDLNQLVPRDMWEKLKSNDRVQTGSRMHITLAVNRKSSPHYKALWEKYESRFKNHGANQEKTFPCTFSLSRLVWNERVMAIEVMDVQPAFESVNQIMHITVGTIDNSVSPFLSNMLLDPNDTSTSRTSLPFDTTVRYSGHVSKFSTAEATNN